MMKNGCKMAVFSIAMHYFLRRDAQLFPSRRTIIYVATHQFFRRDALIAPS